MRLRRWQWVAVYLVWIVLCGILAVALWGWEDPSRRRGRILSTAAGARAIEILHRDSRYRGYEVVHVAYARRGEGGSENRWVVLCDAVPQTGLARAVVVELRASDGSLLGIRRPR